MRLKEALENVQEAVEEDSEELDYIDGTEHMVSSNILVITNGRVITRFLDFGRQGSF
jgi:hypothetical protein